MQPLLVIAALLQLLMASEAQSGGGGEDDDDAPPRGCVVQKPGLNTTAELSWETNLTAAVLRARCYSVCLSEQVICSLTTLPAGEGGGVIGLSVPRREASMGVYVLVIVHHVLYWTNVGISECRILRASLSKP